MSPFAGKSSRAVALPERRVAAVLASLFELGDRLDLSTLVEEHARQVDAVDRDVARRAHLDSDPNRFPGLPLRRREVAGELFHLAAGDMRLGQAVGDAELAANRLRPLELVPGHIEAAEPRIEVRTAEKRVRLDRRKSVLAAPGELFVEEREHLGDRSPPEEHGSSDLVPGLDLAAHVA